MKQLERSLLTSQLISTKIKTNDARTSKKNKAGG
jgi:hypothetical protein